MQQGQPTEAERAQGAPHPAPAAAAAAAPAASEAAAGEGAAMATIHDLPDGLLSAVLARLGRDRAASALLVSKRWHHVFMSEPALWQEFRTVCRPVAAQLALLRRVGGLVSTLFVPEGSDEEQVLALALTQPSRLQDVYAWNSSEQLLAVLPCFTRLTSLCFGQYHMDLPAGLGSTLSLSLSQLRRLYLEGHSLSGQHVAAIAAAPQLVELSIEVGGFEQPQSLLQLSRLRQLTALQIVAQGSGESYHAPPPALFPALRWYALGTSEEEFDESTVVRVCGCEVQFCSFAEQLVEADPGFMQRRDGVPPYLDVTWPRPADRLPALLSMLRPGGVPAITAMQLSDMDLDAAALEPCTALRPVTQLRLSNCEATDSWEAAMVALLRQAPLLASLHVKDCDFSELPECVVAHTGLRQLHLSGSSLDALPAGPYLAGLQWLSFCSWPPADLWPALAGATALTGLELRSSAKGLEAVLAASPPLRQLTLECCSLQQLPIGPGLSALRSLSLRDSSLPPKEIEHIGALLSRLPLLEELNLGRLELPEQLPTGKHMMLLLMWLHATRNVPAITNSLPNAAISAGPRETCAAGLRSLRIDDNELTALPPGLASAPLLTYLDIRGNHRLEASRADIDGLLSSLPHLRKLKLDLVRAYDVERYATKLMRLRDD